MVAVLLSCLTALCVGTARWSAESGLYGVGRGRRAKLKLANSFFVRSRAGRRWRVFHCFGSGWLNFDIYLKLLVFSKCQR